ncbi:hypothetical protein RvVAT039_pl02100 (plasmid) [Agrobacterium vitis]|nr:hypothetical protein RvVAT039_pl02100 [Agrobacterium vitis]
MSKTDIIPAQTNMILTATAIQIIFSSEMKNIINDMLTIIVTITAADRRYIKQNMQDITVIAM